MSRRRPQEERLKKVPISVTIDRELYDFIEALIDHRTFKDRSHAINRAVHYLKWTIENEPMKLFGPPQSRIAPQKRPPVQQRPHRDPPPPR